MSLSCEQSLCLSSGIKPLDRLLSVKTRQRARLGDTHSALTLGSITTLTGADGYIIRRLGAQWLKACIMRYQVALWIGDQPLYRPPCSEDQALIWIEEPKVEDLPKLITHLICERVSPLIILDSNISNQYLDVLDLFASSISLSLARYQVGVLLLAETERDSPIRYIRHASSAFMRASMTHLEVSAKYTRVGEADVHVKRSYHRFLNSPATCSFSLSIGRTDHPIPLVPIHTPITA